MSEINIYAPRKDFTGVVGGVGFINGRAVADEKKHAAALAYFRRAGYAIGSPAPAEDQDVETVTDPDDSAQHEPVKDDIAEVNLPGMPSMANSRNEIVEFAEGMGINTESLNKEEILEAIKKAAATS